MRTDRLKDAVGLTELLAARSADLAEGCSNTGFFDYALSELPRHRNDQLRWPARVERTHGRSGSSAAPALVRRIAIDCRTAWLVEPNAELLKLNQYLGADVPA